MRVSAIEVVSHQETCQLQAWIESDRDDGDIRSFEPFLLWYRYPAWCEPFLSAENGDPFLAALLVAAMRNGEPISIAAPISPRLNAALPDLVAIYGAFDAQAALTAVDRTLTLAPKLAEAHRARAAVLKALGRAEEAKASLDQAAALAQG